MTSHNQQLFELSQKVIPGGVNSPVRAFRSVGGTPLFFQRGQGAYVWDADGKRYIDYVGSWGPMIVGHCHPEVVKAVQDAASRGSGFRCADRGRTGNGGIAVQAAAESGDGAPGQFRHRGDDDRDPAGARLHRAHRIIKFEGCYHGHSDGLLVKAGSGALTFGQPSSSGVPAEIAALTTVLDYNDAAGLERTFAEMGKEIAAVIVEPVAGNMNLITPKPRIPRAHCAACAPNMVRC